MSYKIIGDSCLDLTADLKKDPHFQIIPLTLQVEHTQVIAAVSARRPHVRRLRGLRKHLNAT